MAEPLQLLDADGETPLPLDTRNRQTLPDVVTDITSGEGGGEGIRDFVLKNVSSELLCENITLATLQAPFNPGGGTLSSEWAYLRQDDTYSPYAATQEIATLGPGQSVRVRNRMRSAADAVPRKYLGNGMLDYTYIAVG